VPVVTVCGVLFIGVIGGALVVGAVVCCGGAKLIVAGPFGDTSGVCGLPTGASGFIAAAGRAEEPTAGADIAGVFGAAAGAAEVAGVCADIVIYYRMPGAITGCGV
jgi:hypothetical protein